MATVSDIPSFLNLIVTYETQPINAQLLGYYRYGLHILYVEVSMV
jgi:hypothetical protein